MTEAKQDFIAYIKDGGCYCCFPHWEYPGINDTDIWGWRDELEGQADD